MHYKRHRGRFIRCGDRSPVCRKYAACIYRTVSGGTSSADSQSMWRCIFLHTTYMRYMRLYKYLHALRATLQDSSMRYVRRLMPLQESACSACGAATANMRFDSTVMYIYSFSWTLSSSSRRFTETTCSSTACPMTSTTRLSGYGPNR